MEDIRTVTDVPPRDWFQYDNLDTEHTNIFKAIFECAKDPGSAAKLKGLVDVTVDHFTDEEVGPARRVPLHVTFPLSM